MSKVILIGIAGGNDGHRRVTNGPNFKVVGGNERHHERLTEQICHITEKISKRGKTLDTVSHEEFTDIAAETGYVPQDG